MKLASVPVAARGIDTVTTIGSAVAIALAAAHIDFVVRYLGGITEQELEGVLSSGLGLELVTYSRAPGWLPNAGMGTSDGNTDVSRLKALGVPAGMLLWLDLEGSGGSAADTSAWIEARAAAVVAGGYEAGLYVGDGCVLDAAELYAIPNVTRYWRAFNQGIPEPACGFAQQQLYEPEQTLCGLSVDYNVAARDYRGRAPTMLIP